MHAFIRVCFSAKGYCHHRQNSPQAEEACRGLAAKGKKLVIQALPVMQLANTVGSIKLMTCSLKSILTRLCLQTRLPKALVDELEAALGEHQADLFIVQEASADAPIRNAIAGQASFPADELLKLMAEGVEVLHSFNSCMLYPELLLRTLYISVKFAE